MAHQKHLFKPGRRRHIQRIANEIGGLHHRDNGKVRVGLMQVVQPVVARGQDEPFGVSGPQSGLVHFQLNGVQNGLLAHGFHNAAGAQNGQPARHPDVWVEGALGHGFALRDGDGHRKAAVIIGAGGFPAQGVRDHLPGHMVDGRGSHRLVQTGLGHPAHTHAAVDADVGTLRPQFHRGHDGKPGGHVHVIAAVLFNGAFGPGGGEAAEQGGHFHHKPLGGAQDHGIRCAAGEQQTGRACRAQRRTGAGGVAAAQKLLPTADVVLKFGLVRLGGPEQGGVLLLAQTVERPDILRGKGLVRRQNAGHMVRKDADHRV